MPSRLLKRMYNGGMPSGYREQILPANSVKIWTLPERVPIPSGYGSSSRIELEAIRDGPKTFLLPLFLLPSPDERLLPLCSQCYDHFVCRLHFLLQVAQMPVDFLWNTINNNVPAPNPCVAP